MKSATLFEVGPRDGLQSEAKILSVEERTRIVRGLLAAGISDIEVGSFVKAEWVPQLKDTSLVLKKLQSELSTRERKQARFWAFIPNEYGLRQAAEHGVDGASFFIATSDTFCHKNVNRSQSHILKEMAGLLRLAKKSGLKSRVYLSTLVYCPYEGVIDPKQVGTLVDKLVDIGASEIALSDTTGHANPLSMRKVLTRVTKKHSPKKFALHLHDTRGLALANILESMNFGLARFDSSVGGLGGCPYAPGASGNLATEDLVYMLNSMGQLKSVDLQKVGQVAYLCEDLLGKSMPSRVLKTIPRLPR
ncbi:MAG: hydroxymethylglutaryl-CoA lyase [Bdellovibrionales bacterium]|nr:hydroxymethylglutaryl-CoA lyase [Bdellovibrionales bacterium]